jgi:hypothetical protein
VVTEGNRRSKIYKIVHYQSYPFPDPKMTVFTFEGSKVTWAEETMASSHDRALLRLVLGLKEYGDKKEEFMSKYREDFNLVFDPMSKNKAIQAIYAYFMVNGYDQYIPKSEESWVDFIFH